MIKILTLAKQKQLRSNRHNARAKNRIAMNKKPAITDY